MSKFKEGDHITVVVEGKEYDTIIVDGVQRFISSYFGKLFDAGAVDLNKASIAFHADHSLTLEEYIQMNVDLGYSVCGFEEVMATHEMNTGYVVQIDNPVWNEDENE